MGKINGADAFAELKTSSEEYAVYDSHYERIGKVDDVVLDELNRVAYVGVKMGFFGMDSTLVPVELVRVNDKRRLVEVAKSKEMIWHAPHFGQDETVSPELEDRIRTYFGLEPLHSSHVQEDSYTSAPPDEGRFGADERVDVEPGERARAQASRPVGQEEGVVNDRLSDEPEHRWQKHTTESGVTVHRRSR